MATLYCSVGEIDEGIYVVTRSLMGLVQIFDPCIRSLVTVTSKKSGNVLKPAVKSGQD